MTPLDVLISRCETFAEQWECVAPDLLGSTLGQAAKELATLRDVRDEVAQTVLLQDVAIRAQSDDARAWEIDGLHKRLKEVVEQRDQLKADLAACASNGWVTPEVKRKAEAMDALEEWLRGEDFRFIEASAVVGEGEVQVTLEEHCADPDGGQVVAQEAGDTLSAAILSALAKAKEKK